MHVFLDFEASSLGKTSYPIEVAWVFEDGRGEAHLIRPAEGWTDWDARAEAIHHIPQAALQRDGSPVEVVAARMIAVLTGHDLYASAPSWDGKWLSTLLRAARLPRHSLRLRDTEEAQRAAAAAVLRGHVDGHRLAQKVEEALVLAGVRERGQPAHRALADAREELARWRRVTAVAQDMVTA